MKMNRSGQNGIWDMLLVYGWKMGISYIAQ